MCWAAGRARSRPFANYGAIGLAFGRWCRGGRAAAAAAARGRRHRRWQRWWQRQRWRCAHIAIDATCCALGPPPPPPRGGRVSSRDWYCACIHPSRTIGCRCSVHGRSHHLVAFSKGLRELAFQIGHRQSLSCIRVVHACRRRATRSVHRARRVRRSERHTSHATRARRWAASSQPTNLGMGTESERTRIVSY